MKAISSLLLLVFLSVSVSAQENLTRLLRQPDIHGDQVAFVYAGDIWLASTSGGEARRLTSDEGMEYFPKFSPDGRWIAFTGEYSGSVQVFVIPVQGGQPRQLTFYNDVGPMPPRGGIDNRILDWTPDGKHILFLPHRLPWGDRMARPYVVPFEGGMERPLAIPEGGGGMYSPDGTKIVYTPIEREFRTWKGYRGGRAQDVWIYDLVNNRAEQITDNPYTDNQPLWIGNRIYFTSDREGGRLNLWSYDLATKQTAKVTNHNEYDVLWPSSDRTQAVYEYGGYLWRFDPASGRSERIPIRVSSDLRRTLPYFRNVRDNIETFTLSPTGARALFVARGDVFTVPAKEGEIRNATQTPGIRERDASWSPDGRWLAYLSDRSGEYELYVRPADGGGEERQITKAGSAWRLTPRWSPDSKMIAWADKDRMLHVVDVASGRITPVDQDQYGDIDDYRWSPDSRWLTYTKLNQARFSSVFVHNLAERKTHQLTSGMTNDGNPVFDPKGRYLYFTSNRDFNLTFSSWEFNYVYTDPARVYVGVLAADGPALFLPQSDEEKLTAPPAPAPAATDAKAAAAPVVVKIDPAGFENRVRAIPGAPGQYSSLNALSTGVLYVRGAGEARSLKFYNIDDRKEETILDTVQNYELSSNGEKILARVGNNYSIVNAKPAQKPADSTLNLTNLQMRIDPKAEWAQVYNDAWRILRDWFYDPAMHGLDWNAMRDKYGQLVPHVAHRADLDYILGELGGDLNAGHVYVGSPSELMTRRVDNGLLGAEIVPDSGLFRITKIFPGENWHEHFRSPLTEPGVNVRSGDYILAVDGVSTRGVDNFYRLLENKADRVVTLRLNSRPDLAGSREEKVRPIKKETNLRYLDWVQSRRDYVDKASGGRIGYMHLPNTAQEGNRELFRSFYPQVDKDALIIDDRYNGGGFIPDRMIELLDRQPLNYWVRRGMIPTATPAFAHVGPKAMLINGYSSSGGDALPYYFRKRNLGTIIGTRTWGGLIGISGNPSLMDGGSITAPTFRFLDTDGMWAVEGIGVAPDIEVVDRPDLVAAGQDPSLEAAVKLLLEQLAKNPPQRIVVPPVTVER
jgi:tricorn protease